MISLQHAQEIQHCVTVLDVSLTHSLHIAVNNKLRLWDGKSRRGCTSRLVYVPLHLLYNTSAKAGQSLQRYSMYTVVNGPCPL